MSRPSVLVFVALVAATMAGTAFARWAVESHEHTALVQRSEEASVLLAEIGDQVETAFESAAALGRGPGFDPDTFSTAADREVAGGDFDFMAVVTHDGGDERVIAVSGDGVAVGSLLTGPAADLVTRSRSSSGLRGDTFAAGGGRRVAFAVRADEGHAVYGESALTDEGVSTVTSRGPFAGIDVALYVGQPADSERLVLATAEAPFSGPSVTVPVRVGADTWIAVVAARGRLTGEVTGWLPWVIGVLGLAAAVAVAFATEAHLRRLHERERAERDAELSQLKSILLASVSHELRTPLAVVVGLAELLRSDDDRLATADRAQLYDRLHVQSNRLRRLVEDLLDATSLESGHLAVTCAPTSLAEPLLAAAYDRDVHSDRIELDMEDDMPLVMADGERVRQVVGNLVDNALKYSPPDGKVRVSVMPDGQWVRIRVADEGPGIAAEFRPALFSPFTQAGPGERNGGGVGLGLYITKGLVEAMGGGIDVHSDHGQGTTIEVSLRRAPDGFATAGVARAEDSSTCSA